MAVTLLPGIGDTIGDATVLDMREGAAYGHVVVLGLWDNPVTPFATWLYDPERAILYSGHYFAIRDAAEVDFATR
jgi:hypothetical protein